MIIYLLLLALVVGIHSLYLGRPLIELYRVEAAEPLTMGLELEIAVGVTIGLSVVGLSRFASARFAWAQRIDRDFGELFSGHSPTHLTGLAVMSALAEELLFRGLLLDAIGLVWSSVIFGGLHVPIERAHWPWSLSALVMGFIFGWSALLTGSITVALIAHFTVNHFNLHALKARALTREAGL